MFGALPRSARKWSCPCSIIRAQAWAVAELGFSLELISFRKANAALRQTCKPAMSSSSVSGPWP